jgi:hypothetical protein
MKFLPHRPFERNSSFVQPIWRKSFSGEEQFLILIKYNKNSLKISSEMKFFYSIHLHSIQF